MARESDIGDWRESDIDIREWRGNQILVIGGNQILIFVSGAGIRYW